MTMEEKEKKGFWGEYFESLSEHPLRTSVATIIVMDGIVRVAQILFGKSE